MKLFAAIGILLLATSSAKGAVEGEPGPEDGGLRLRLAVVPRDATGEDGFDVRIDLLNVSARDITIRAGWEGEDSGEVKDYLEAATSIECVPAIAPWIGGVAARPDGNKSPPPEFVLKGRQTLSVRWQTKGRRLKNRVSDPSAVQNPTFSFTGLYSVHANLDVITTEGTVRLRSNEQLVPVGGSRTAPKHTYGQLWSIDGQRKTAVLGLGSLHKVEVGDRFQLPSKQALWQLTVTDVRPRFSEGKLELLSRSADSEPALPPRLAHVILVADQAEEK